jgi:hypothetical protein
MVIIGATCASSVSFENSCLQMLFADDHDPDHDRHFLVLSKPIYVIKGTPLGRFHYGGSTIILLIQGASSNHLLTRLLAASKKDIETEIEVEQPVLFYNKN